MSISRPQSISDLVKEYLLSHIRSGEYAPGEKIPSESELAQALGVSRSTVRNVLSSLEAERLINRWQGDGTYVSRRVMEVKTSLSGKWDFGCMIEDSGRKPSIRNLNMGVRPVQPREAEMLELKETDSVFAMTRLFLADDKPVIHSTNIIPFKLFNPNMGEPDVTLPIHEFLYRYCSEQISFSISDITATCAIPELESTLGLTAGVPVLNFEDVFYNLHDQPLLYGLNFYNDKALRMRVAKAWG